jgi:hypothetical protein
LRILRGKSNLEVSSQGFAWFVVGLVLASFIGGAVRTLLSSNAVHTRIVSELRNRFPKQQFEIGQTEVLLSRGLWPGLGLRLRNLTFRQETCGKLSFVLEVPDAILPVDLFSLRHGRVRLGHVELKDGKIHFDYKPCPKADETVVGENDFTTKPEKPVISARSLDWRKASEHLKAIDLTNFEVTYEQNATWKVLVQSLNIDVGDELYARGILDVQKSLPFGTLSHRVNVDALGDNKVMQFGMHSEFKEGFLNLKGSLDMNHSAAMVQVNARQLPLKDVMSELYQMGFLERDVALKTTWLSCGLHWEGALAHPSASPVRAQDCKIEGGYGRVDLERAEFFTDAGKAFKAPAKLKVTKLQVQPLLEVLGREVLPAVLPKPGVWSGTISYSGPKEWDLDGDLENVEVAFSNHSVRGKQLLEKMHTRVNKTGAKIEAKLDEIVVRDGDFKGILQFTLQEDWRNGRFDADVERLRLSQSIQNLLIGGKIGNLKFKGDGTLTGGELSRWEGQFELDNLAGGGWTGDKISVKSRYTPGLFHLEGKVNRVSVMPSFTLYSQLHEVYPQAASEVRWQDVIARVDIQANGGTIPLAQGTLEGPARQVWKLKGSWVRDGEFNGTLSTGKGRPFSFSGEKGNLRILE